MASDLDVQQLVYRHTVESGRPPRAREVAAALGIDEDEALASFRRLNERRLLALAPGSGEIVMAPPFSATPTGFLVHAAGRDYFANCVWDAYGIAAALHADATIDASCACCGEPMTLRVENGTAAPAPGIAHFAVPAAQWWANLTYT